MERFQVPKPKFKRNMSERLASDEQIKPAIKKADNILKQEKYLDQLARIIRRDFFPQLYEYIDRDENRRKTYSYQDIKTPVPNGSEDIDGTEANNNI